MSLEIILAIIIIRYLRKLQKNGTLVLPPGWDKIFIGGIVISIVLLVIGFTFHDPRDINPWLTHLFLLSIIYIIFKNKQFHPAKPLIHAILPYIVIAILGDLVELISPDFYREWKNYFNLAGTFAVIWMIAMWLMTRKQRKALDAERLKTLEKEKENRITESLKAALEVQVAERTSALTLQKEELQHALDELKSTQAQLIHSEKMASLGELTAGIAHEIQNPLNFVNNFSEVNTELIEEMKTELKAGNNEDAIAIANDISANEQKINHHGKRADAIVKGMLHHSRTSNGVKESTNINALADEYLRLAYHGLRAKDKSFNATMKTDYDASIGDVNVIPQDIGRVILNLITNAFYAVTEKKKSSSLLPPEKIGTNSMDRETLQKEYEPTVSVSTKKIGAKSDSYRVEIKVTDNGSGIPQKVLDKIFQPFFTTKPTGQGTGLGLSISYDIVTKGHGGELKVETKEGEGTSFIIIIPA